MSAENNKTPIPSTPFFVIPSVDFFIRDEGVGAYQIESVPFVAEGVEGILDVELQQGLVHVRVCFGSESWGVGIGSPVVIDNVHYSVSLHSPPVALDDFDLALAADSLSFSMSNLDDRSTGPIGMNLPRLVKEADPAHAETCERFVRSVSRNIKDIDASYPAFAKGFRQAVAVLEIARLRDEQAEAWREMSIRTTAIHHYMSLVPEEMARVAPWTFSSQENVPRLVELKRAGLEVNASGVHHVTVKLADGATFVITTLIDGTIRTEIMRP
jgi:hypothetical protein